jgi:hypothetical protein
LTLPPITPTIIFYACFTSRLANRFDILDYCRVYGSKY